MIDLTLNPLNLRFLFVIGLTLFITSPFALSDTDDPVLNAISINQTIFDVSEGAQEIIFTVDASDESGINWGAGRYNTSFVIYDAAGDEQTALGDNDNPGIFKITIDSTAKNGSWQPAALYLQDNAGNEKYFGSRDLSSAGAPSSFEVVGGVESDPPVVNAISINQTAFDVSNGAQELVFTVDASDESGINWSSRVYSGMTRVTMQDAGGNYVYAYGSNDDPGKISLTLDSSMKNGTWQILFLALTDNLGTQGSYCTTNWISSDCTGSVLTDLGLPADFDVSGGVESDAPIINAISVNKVTVDVTQGPQTVKWSIDSYDESGVNWENIYYTNILLQDSGGGFHRALGDNDNPGILSLTLDSNSASGRYRAIAINLTDTLGNTTTQYSSYLENLGLPTFIYVLADGESTSNITLSKDASIASVAENSEVSYNLTIENLADTPTGQLSFELKSSNIRVSAVSQSGSSACNISSSNYNSTVTCALSGVDANSSKSLNLTMTPGSAGTGTFHANIVADIADISYLNNYVTVPLTIDPDGDGDGISDDSDNCPSTSNSDQLDTDSDGNGNVCDTDDDGDGVEDSSDAFPLDASETSDTDSDGIGDNSDNCPSESNSDQLDTDSDGSGNACDTDDDGDGVEDSSDAFPLDPSESLDTDSDGIGNNADTDDDGDGVSDTDDAYPLISLNGLTDTDNDGIPNECDAACLETGMTADSDDDGDGVPDSEDAFPLDGSETTDTDGDGVGDNSDAFPNNHEYTKDTDSDGMPDAWETQFGLDPNDPSDASGDADNDGVSNLDEFLNGTPPSGSLDIDGNERYDALTDGLLILRSMFGLDGASLTAGTAASDAVYSDSGELITRINTLGDLADIDGSGEIDALTDGLLILRFLFGLEGDTLVNGVVSSNATRTTQEIEDHLNMLMPVN